MAKPHKYAWNGLDAETSLTVEQLANMAQRAALESTGDLLKGKHRIVSTRSGDREIEFRINDFLISFNKLMVFSLNFTVNGGRTYASTSIDWYLTTQSTVGGFIPVSTKTMVSHHTFMQFVNNLAAQIRAADPTARITIRQGVQDAAPAASAPAPQPSSAIPPPPPPAAPAFVPVPPPPAAPVSAPVPPVPAAPPLPPPPATDPAQLYEVAPAPSRPAAPAGADGLVTGIPGMPSRDVPPPPAPVPPPPAPAPVHPQPAPAAPAPIVGLAPAAAQLFAEDEDLDSTRMQSAASALPWTLAFADGQSVSIGAPIVVGRDPAAPASHPSARPVPVADPYKSVSKTHAAIELREGLLWVTDLHSTNGTKVTNAVGEATSCPPGIAMPVGDGWTVSTGEFAIVARVGA